MILLVPISPEIPKFYTNQLWPGLVLVILLCLGFLEASSTLDADSQFVESLYSVAARPVHGELQLSPKAVPYLALRPLLKISPSRADWDFKRILYANFIHGSQLHLFLNLIGIFAGARICSAFIPFSLMFCLFILGGSIGILASVLFGYSISPYTPHVGASGGIFALMGIYYVYNFRFRTQYFYWFPSRQWNTVSLKTSWFFFLDVILLEIVLSASQFLPGRIDNVDHLAHVFGFAAGVVLATLVRRVQKWPSFLQTRVEFLYWKTILAPTDFGLIIPTISNWLDLLRINPYNDQIKLKLYKETLGKLQDISRADLELVFYYTSPTFVRLHADQVGRLIRNLLFKNIEISQKWLMKMPYDTIIRIAKELSHSPNEQPLILKLVLDYQKSQPDNADHNRKLELLKRKLKDLVPQLNENAPRKQ